MYGIIALAGIDVIISRLFGNGADCAEFFTAGLPDKGASITAVIKTSALCSFFQCLITFVSKPHY